jgi:hypothetical protein
VHGKAIVRKPAEAADPAPGPRPTVQVHGGGCVQDRVRPFRLVACSTHSLPVLTLNHNDREKEILGRLQTAELRMDKERANAGPVAELAPSFLVIERFERCAPPRCIASIKP